MKSDLFSVWATERAWRGWVLLMIKAKDIKELLKSKFILIAKEIKKKQKQKPLELKVGVVLLP